jgi:hypothetical protein
MPLERRRAINPPVDWTVEEENNLLEELRNNGFHAQAMNMLFPTRTLASIRSKVRKLRIQHDLFGEGYRKDKGDFTTIIAHAVRPKCVFEGFAGAGHQTFRWLEQADVVYAAEHSWQKLSQFEQTAVQHGFKTGVKKGNWFQFRKGQKKVFLFIGDNINAAVDISAQKICVDLLDLDTCGSALPTLPIFLAILRPKHLVITHGEFHSMRFKREDVLRRLLIHRDVKQNPFPLTVDSLSSDLDKAVKLSALRSHNETVDSFWAELVQETWLGNKFHGMLRRWYKLERPAATSDCINQLS